MDDQLKTKIHSSMKEYLTSKGWPNMPSHQIAQELPNLWKKLEKESLLKDLTKRGFNFTMFVKIALQTKHECETINNTKSQADIFAEFMRRARGY